jgi:hypothetical protein
MMRRAAVVGEHAFRNLAGLAQACHRRRRRQPQRQRRVDGRGERLPGCHSRPSSKIPGRLHALDAGRASSDALQRMCPSRFPMAFRNHASSPDSSPKSHRTNAPGLPVPRDERPAVARHRAPGTSIRPARTRTLGRTPRTLRRDE